MQAIHRERAPAKLTRSLRVVGVRNDGYHLLDAEMVSLDLADELEFFDGEGLEVIDSIAWLGGEGNPASTDAPRVPTGADNLVARALELTERRVRIRLTKRIPPGAGLGGGSSDAAAVLRWAGFGDTARAARLGADVPFCLRGGRARVGGVGELLEQLPTEQRAFVLLTPAYGVATSLVYRAFDDLGPNSQRTASLNDLEAAALVVEPRLKWARDLLAEVTETRPNLAGSGSTWFVECDPDQAGACALELSEAVAASQTRSMVALGRTVGAFSP